MGVYVVGGNVRPWYDYLAEAGTQLLGGMIKNQFDKSAEKRKFQMERDKAEAEYQRQQMARDADIARYRGLGFDRNNEGAFLQDMAIRDMLTGGDDNFHKDLQATNLSWLAQDRGDRITAGFANPTTGQTAFSDYGIGINPTDRMKADALLRQERMSQAGANSRAAMNANPPEAFSLYTDPAGKVSFVGNRGTIRDTPLAGAPAQGQEPPRLTPGDMVKLFPHFYDPYGGAVKPGMEEIEAATRENFLNILRPPTPYGANTPAIRTPIDEAAGEAVSGASGGGLGFRQTGNKGIIQGLYESLIGGVGRNNRNGEAVSGLPDGVSEKQVQEMIKDSGKDRDEVISFIKRKMMGTRKQ
jgi:hypothetical protein